ncbi:MAG TPA: mannose-1-phosphate guanylyltransferase/mannose-6-phosphate isomerase [Alphaproteobacteria bacterium]|nr:mannose-1-phosphate guanylyltransferase/mannose-6-phosphate isomerase [Alphaproteobacteria bacterium]
MTSTIHPVILCGGSGTRLWPLSRALHPKQLLALTGTRSLLQETLARVADPAHFTPPHLLCNERHRFQIAEQLREAGVEAAAIVLEPAPRNTAPAVAAGALILAAVEPDALMLVLPSDHVIGDAQAFQSAVVSAADAAEAGALVTFGIAPDGPQTGYGYIERGAALDGVDGAYSVARFVEKPNAKTAAAMIAQGGYFWNSGMFLFRARRYLDELAAHAPAMLAAVEAAVAKGRQEQDFYRLDAAAYEASPSDSIDYAVMEKTADTAVVPADLGWSDVGAWSTLWEIGDKDKASNVIVGDVIAVEAKRSYLRSDGPLVAAIGVEDIVIVAAGDAVLVAPRDRVQDVKLVTDRLAAAGRSEHESHPAVERPWGSYQTVDAGEGFQVKRIIVRPGARLSLQKHAQRAEHWVVVRGQARVTRDDEVFDLTVDQSAYIPLGAVHRLENIGPEPLHLIEVQSGGYLGEDDIVRLDDEYGRA